MSLYGHRQCERLEAKDLNAESSRLKAQRKCNGQLTIRNKHSEADRIKDKGKRSKEKGQRRKDERIEAAKLGR
jgi:hypothetical protein